MLVELGQLAVVAFLLPLIFALRETSLYPRVLLRAGSSAIAALGGPWLVERAFDLRLLWMPLPSWPEGTARTRAPITRLP